MVAARGGRWANWMNVVKRFKLPVTCQLYLNFFKMCWAVPLCRKESFISMKRTVFPSWCWHFSFTIQSVSPVLPTVLFIIACIFSWRIIALQCYADGWIKKMWHIYTMEYYLAIKRNSFESVLVRWMKLAPVIQSEVSHKEKNKYRILMHVYESGKMVLMNLFAGQEWRHWSQHVLNTNFQSDESWDDWLQSLTSCLIQTAVF